MRPWRAAVVLGVVAGLVVGVAWAQEVKQKPKKEPKPAQPQIPALDQWLRGVELSAEQKEKVEALKREFAPAIAEVNKAMEGVFTEEQRKIRREIAAKGKAEGKTPQEVRKLQDEAVKLTPEQKEKIAQLTAQRREVLQKLAKHLLEILTPEQKQVVEPLVEKTLKAGAPKQRQKVEEAAKPKKEQKEQKNPAQQQS
ncbi:MAG: hypothetical protein NZ899_10200 [Thermoguttaceae bacterium]|nr:hypothetical protein [Thermoguttaceae bacterium]MDW8078057.1 hypothetical protein [Thermoguttaceae bacterium]